MLLKSAVEYLNYAIGFSNDFNGTGIFAGVQRKREAGEEKRLEIDPCPVPKQLRGSKRPEWTKRSPPPGMILNDKQEDDELLFEDLPDPMLRMSSMEEDDDELQAAQDAMLRQMTELRQSGMTDEQILEKIATEQLMGTGIDIPDEVPPTLPRQGSDSFGLYWSQSASGFYLELSVPPDTSAKSIVCEAQVGFLDVRIADEPVLSGRLAQPVLSDVEWAIDVRAEDGQRILCIDLEKRKADAADALAAEALFTSLRLRGEEIAQAGLVAGVYVDDKEGGSGGGGLPLL